VRRSRRMQDSFMNFSKKYIHTGELKVTNKVLEQRYYKLGEDCLKNGANVARIWRETGLKWLLKQLV